MKLIIFILFCLILSVSGKPSIKIITGLLDDLIHKVSPKSADNHVHSTMPYPPQSAPYINYPPQDPYIQQNTKNVNPYEPVSRDVIPYQPIPINVNIYPQAPYPITDPFYNPLNGQKESYTLNVLTEPSSDKVTTELYPPSGPAGIYDNILFVQDPPLDDVNNNVPDYANKIDVRSGMWFNKNVDCFLYGMLKCVLFYKKSTFGIFKYSICVKV